VTRSTTHGPFVVPELLQSGGFVVAVARPPWWQSRP
jgi:hypothetical protein